MSTAPIAVVTGITGFVGAELAVQLVQQGYAVRGVVRCTIDSPRAQSLVGVVEQARHHATSHPGTAQGSLQLFQADLLHPDHPGLVGAVQGAHYVFHVASPFQIEVADVEADLIRPAEQGTRNVVTAAARYARDTLKKVVVTSSVAAVHDCHCKQPPSAADGLYCEQDFNTTSTPDKEGYWVSKVRGERAAWAAGEAEGVAVVAILPEFVMGPPRTAEAAATSLSSSFLKGFLEAGVRGVEPPSGAWIFSDVREVAAAHIAAATSPTASGRYIIAHNRCLDSADVAAVLSAAFPNLRIPAGKAEPKVYNLNTTKAQKELQMTPYRDSSETLVDMGRALLDMGLVQT